MRKQKLLAALLALVMVLTLLPLTAFAAGDDGTQYVTKWLPITDPTQIKEGTEVKIVYVGDTAGTKALYGYVNGTNTTDQWDVTINADGSLDHDALVAQANDRDLCTSWIISPSGNGYTIQSKAASGYYINLKQTTSAARGTAGSTCVPTATESQTLQIAAAGDGVTISGTSSDATYYIKHDDVTDGNRWFYVGNDSGTTLKLFTPMNVEVEPEPEPEGLNYEQKTNDEGTPLPVDHTKNYPNGFSDLDQPFVSNKPSANYRIPALITTSKGTLLAACDARWNQKGDAANLDTIVARSDDNGATWSNSFANYFEDVDDGMNVYGTAFIDPAMIEGPDGKIYLLVDLWPAAVALNTAPNTPDPDTDGYVDVGGERRLALYASADPKQQDDSNWTHYVGDFDKDGYAPVFAKADTNGVSAVAYVDRYYYLYDTNHSVIYCHQLKAGGGLTETDVNVQANVFFYRDPVDANGLKLHVRATSYLWLVTSDDDGLTWSEPEMLNPMVRGEKERTGESGSKFYGVGPGRGLTLSENADHPGRILFALYTWGTVTGTGNADGYTSVIYKDPEENTWHRSEHVSQQTSEATLVEVEVRGRTKLYMFARHGKTFASDDCGEHWTQTNDWPSGLYNGCQIDAIVYSKLVDGQPAILLAGPSNGRTNGKIWVGLVDQATGKITWRSNPYQVNETGYAYSCLTEKTDGNLGLLYEGTPTYVNLQISDVISGASIGNDIHVEMSLYDEVTRYVAGADSVEDLQGLDNSIVSAEYDEDGIFVFTGIKVGTTGFTCGDITYTFTVTEDESEIQVIDLDAEQQWDGSILIPGTGEDCYSIFGNTVTVNAELEESHDGTLQLGTDYQFTGDKVALQTALHTVTKNSDDTTWTMSAVTKSGDTVYFYLGPDGTGGFPHRNSAHKLVIAAATDGTRDYGFTLQDMEYNGSHLYFWITSTDTSKYHRYDRNSVAAGDNTSFELYTTRDTGHPATGALEGYYQIQSVDEIEDGDQLLVVNYDNNNTPFVLYPSADQNNRFTHVAKLLDASEKTTVYSTRLTVTAGTTAGVTDLVVGDQIYRFIVTADEPATPPVVNPPVVTPPTGGDTQVPDDEPPLDAEPDDGTDIEDTTPLAPIPDDGDTDIEDGDTPLDSTPKTGDDSIAIAVLWSIFSLSAVGFASVMLGMKKSGKHTR